MLVNTNLVTILTVTPKHRNMLDRVVHMILFKLRVVRFVWSKYTVESLSYAWSHLANYRSVVQNNSIFGISNRLTYLGSSRNLLTTISTQISSVRMASNTMSLCIQKNCIDQFCHRLIQKAFTCHHPLESLLQDSHLLETTPCPACNCNNPSSWYQRR